MINSTRSTFTSKKAWRQR